MLNLALVTGLSPHRVEVDDFSSSIGNACLKHCVRLCLLTDEALGNIDSADALVLARGEASSNCGFVCWGTDSAEFVESLPSDRFKFHCYCAEVEGLLDDGLRPGADFELADAVPWRELSGHDQSFRASENLRLDGWWCFVLRAERHAVLALLNSSTKGFLLGVRITDAQTGGVMRLVRDAGYVDGHTDLLLFEGSSATFTKALVSF